MLIFNSRNIKDSHVLSSSEFNPARFQPAYLSHQIEFYFEEQAPIEPRGSAKIDIIKLFAIIKP